MPVTPPSPIEERELSVTRVFDCSPDKVYRAWTEPELFKQWFTPPPVKVTFAEFDLRAGGSSLVVMQLPDGTEMPNRGVYLEVIPNKKLVFTNAYVSDWEPSNYPFMTAVITLENVDGKTRYTAKALHWSVADREAHEKMGFHTGWGIASDQLGVLASTL